MSVRVLTEGVHSGSGSGIAASCIDVSASIVGSGVECRIGSADQGLYVEFRGIGLRREVAATAGVLGDSVRARPALCSAGSSAVGLAGGIDSQFDLASDMVGPAWTDYLRYAMPVMSWYGHYRQNSRFDCRRRQIPIKPRE